MMRCFVVLLMTIIFVSCESRVSKLDYDLLYEQYIDKQEAFNSLQYECDNLKRKIRELNDGAVEYSNSIMMLNIRISRAKDCAEACEEYYEKVENRKEDYNYKHAKNKIEDVKDSVVACCE